MRRSDSLWTRSMAVLAIVGMASAARADFFEDFESYTTNGPPGAPWVNNHRVAGNSIDLVVTPDPSGFNMAGQGVAGPGGSFWFENERPSGFDGGELAFQFQWKARLRAGGGIPRLNAAIYSADGSSSVGFETDGNGDKIVGSVTGLGTVSTNAVLRDTWYRMTVTIINDGMGNWSWSGALEQDTGGGSFTPAGSLGSTALPAGFTPSWVHLASLYAFIEGPTSSEMSAIDDVSFVSGIVGGPVTSATVRVEDTFGTEFLSEAGVTYGLESTTDLVTSNNWTSTGAFVTGDGTTMFLFDPATFSTSKAYRVISNP